MNNSINWEKSSPGRSAASKILSIRSTILLSPLRLDGKIKTVNRRVTELLGIPYAEVIGHRLDEFLDEPKREEVDRGLSRFLEKRRWSGLVPVRLKSSSKSLYFDCALNAIVKGDEVVGVSALARDVTEEQQKERRFTELFETLQEGVYFSTPEGKILDGNVALVYVLGYESKEELLALDSRALNADPNQNPVLGRSADDQGGVRTREITLRRKDGSPGVFLDTSRAVWDAGGKIVRYQGTLVDVSERREMERALRLQEEFHRYLLESFPRPYPGNRFERTLQFREFAHSGSARFQTRKFAGQES